MIRLFARKAALIIGKDITMGVKNEFLISKTIEFNEMRIEISNTEFRPGTTVRRVYLYEDDGDVVMTDAPVYEDEIEDDDGNFDGPVDDDSCV